MVSCTLCTTPTAYVWAFVTPEDTPNWAQELVKGLSYPVLRSDVAKADDGLFALAIVYPLSVRSP